MYQIYQMMPGETIESVSQKLGVSANKLREINGLTENSIVKAGSYLVIPTQNQTGYQTYIVKAGDSLYSIASTYNIDYKTLASLNGLKEGEYIYPNQEIMVPLTNEDIYIVKENDTIDTILKNTKKTINEIMNLNKNIYLLPDQVIKY